MAELHIIGTILGASEFHSSSLCCKWAAVAGNDWNLIEGDSRGQTQVDMPQVCVSTSPIAKILVLNLLLF